MLRFTVLLILFSLSAFSRADSPLSYGPFQGVDLNILSLSQREAITQASDDFEQVLRGKLPKYAIFDDKAPLPSDGGTEFFIGKGYKLTVIKSLSSFGSAEGLLTGYIYGPKVTFERSFAPGNMSEVVSLRFYTPEQLKKLVSNQ